MNNRAGINLDDMCSLLILRILKYPVNVFMCYFKNKKNLIGKATAILLEGGMSSFTGPWEMCK